MTSLSSQAAVVPNRPPESQSTEPLRYLPNKMASDDVDTQSDVEQLYDLYADQDQKVNLLDNSDADMDDQDARKPTQGVPARGG